jgi:hypothetical protein
MTRQFQFRLAHVGQLLAVGCVLATTIAATSIAQPPPGSTVKSPTEVATLPIEAQQDASAAETTVPMTPAQMPPVAPQVSYRDGQLTIIAENCSLGDILREVHRLTGVQIDLPAAASAERMAARLGPGSTRDVLTSLLGSTDFNYIMQAADDDPNEVQSLLLMPRTKDSPATAGQVPPSRWAQRRPSRVTQPVSEASENSEVPPIMQVSPADPAETSQEVTTPAEGQPTPPSTSSIQADLGSASSTPVADMSPTEQMMQGMKRLYEQRRQMQEQQNQKTSGSAAPQQ